MDEAGSRRAATADEVDRAAWRAWEAFDAAPPVDARARALDLAADGLDAHPTLVGTVCEETAYAAPRVRTELIRTSNQLRAFAALIREGSWVEATIDHGDPARTPTPKPDLRRMLLPLGPVGVFGASNFPLAYGVAGGDTSGALAAGCPVIVKEHSAQPRTGEAIAAVVEDACARAGLPPGFFVYLPASGERAIEVGLELVRHPRVRAVGFTGSVQGGMSLARAASERPEPIPVYAEMGSVNPVFVLPGAARSRGAAIGAMLGASATASGGQMCTCPGLIFVTPQADAVVEALRGVFASAGLVTMLTPRTASLFAERLADVQQAGGARVVARGGEGGEGGEGDAARAGTPTLLEAGLDAFLNEPTLREECFGPSTIVVRCEHERDFARGVGVLPGSLTGSVFADDAEWSGARGLVGALRERVGRLIFNGVPTGVEVVPAMNHTGPFPACNRPDTTAVGAYSIRRWCRPVCFQNAPAGLLPEELRDGNPRGIWRLVDGARVRG
ncbi:MAG: aldehyde dehydrogenase family protein [Planctomycetota bacterium]|nr:aldehyde dehydrogenase family protein [Planctomycetota bacterium]